MSIFIIITLFIIGSILGSFGSAQVWRLRARQLAEDKRSLQSIKKDSREAIEQIDFDEREYRKLRHLIRPVSSDRSECLSCGHRLAWYDLVPIISWLRLGGRCRYCGKSIGKIEFFHEVLLATSFVLTFLYWPFPLIGVIDLIIFVLFLVLLVVLSILFVYDLRWSLLPFNINLLMVVLAGVFGIFLVVMYGFTLLGVIWSVLILGGLYALFASLNWSGFGDSILGFGLALVLADWRLAFLVLFLANLLGSLTLIPIALKKRLRRNMKIPFGPFLIISFFIAFLWGGQLIDWYLASSELLFESLML